jgi:monofunctional biosynthetic peptidoglycan transglycosylase
VSRWLIFAAVLAITGAVGLEAKRVDELRQKTPRLVERILERSADSLPELSDEEIDILVAVEDPTFWDNDGIDFRTPGQGWTTLSQALAKRLYYKDYVPGLQKLDVVLFTRFALIPEISKEDILDAFVAAAYLGTKDGRAVVGFASAAEAWFGKPFSELKRREYIELVAMLIGPDEINPRTNTLRLDERADRIERLVAGECAPIVPWDVHLNMCGPVTQH